MDSSTDSATEESNPSNGSHPLWGMADPTGPTAYQFGTHEYTHAHVMTRRWRGVEHSKCLHGQPVLAASTDEVLNSFAAAVAEAKEFCSIAFTKGSVPLPAPQQTTSPVLIESGCAGGAAVPAVAAAAVDTHLGDIALHETSLRQHWDCFRSSPTDQSMAKFSLSLDATIGTVMALATFLSTNPLATSPPTTMRTIQRTLVMSVVFDAWTRRNMDVMLLLPDKCLVHGFFSVLLWSLHSVVVPQLEPNVVKQWARLTTTVSNDISETTLATWEMVQTFFRHAASDPTCAEDVMLSFGWRTRHIPTTLRQFQVLHKMHEDVLQGFDLFWTGRPIPNGSVTGSLPRCLSLSSQTLPRPMVATYNDVAAPTTGSTQVNATHVTPQHSDMSRTAPSIVEYTVAFGCGPLGLSLKPLAQGIVLGDVLPNTPASRSGVIKKGDVLVKIQGVAIGPQIESIARLVKSSVRPVQLTFRRPLGHT
ncbi:hypothetical protein H257_04011 [Aphanomyces astaci]|uniref:PDZ domain-containing protein n=1 Tax=Aphanomyces astaci TaxID=112090 RepID=W4GU76_APHAT|nr:hypothetical protein H257_04011 [Aphanomyces astaci]ETV83237.1 hypothetical protein H257_04011 [Aphanomyces astaci]|eukprot:XP_009826667.1 hypothetical protein H257_04011 [Aphanomyces astaci]